MKKLIFYYVTTKFNITVRFYNNSSTKTQHTHIRKQTENHRITLTRDICVMHDEQSFNYYCYLLTTHTVFYFNLSRF
jgi:hypothetical protein